MPRRHSRQPALEPHPHYHPVLCRPEKRHRSRLKSQSTPFHLEIGFFKRISTNAKDRPPARLDDPPPAKEISFLSQPRKLSQRLPNFFPVPSHPRHFLLRHMRPPDNIPV